MRLFKRNKPSLDVAEIIEFAEHRGELAEFGDYEPGELRRLSNQAKDMLRSEVYNYAFKKIRLAIFSAFSDIDLGDTEKLQQVKMLNQMLTDFQKTFEKIINDDIIERQREEEQQNMAKARREMNV